MRYLVVLLLAGCTHAVTLLPRAGGEKAYGSFNDGSRNMTVTIGGETYTGSYVRGQTTGLAFGAGGAITPAVGVSNQHSALLVGEKGNVRCEWMRSGFGGNGVCQDRMGVIYDLVVGSK